ncbi:MAG: cysteine--tRNA ligase [Pseudomonadota bacterium]|nr:cysteine--tRNA ligase [Pseudomonadota bacterium]
MIRLHDTMAREKRLFEPADPKRITMYVCGPTVYGRAHIGNARPAVVFDTLARLLRHEYGEGSVVHAANITDIEDKIMAAAAAENVPIETITERYGRFYFDDLAALGVPRPDIVPLATQTIPQMIGMIARLIEAGHAYAAEGHVLFDVPSWPDYGRLSRRPMDEMIAGARVDVAPYKRSPADFVLWKPSSDEQPGWDSPWGRGRPGWHIECSAMIEAHLGETIDIHGGGLDLEFPHHENEVAQSSCSHGGAPLARYWLHNGMLSMASAKMSKSIGNVVRINELLEQGHKGETLRLALLSANYRQPLAWTEALVEQSKATLDRLYRAAGDVVTGEPDPGVVEALSDDLNTPLAMSRLIALDDPAVLRASAGLLGILQSSADSWFKGEGDDSQIERRIAERAAAKQNRDFAAADRIRDELKAEGILLEDGPSGTIWRRE